MPILGSSSIAAYGGGGPTGDTGPGGPRGALGNPGVTKGTTGTTGDYIKYVVSDRSQNKITFILDSGNSIILTGFTGATGEVYNIDGISGSIGSTLVGGFKIASGFTFSFYGISGTTGISITTDPNNIIVTYSPQGINYTQNPVQDKIAFVQLTALAGCGSGCTGINATKIYTDSNNILYFGLTGAPTGVTANLLYTNLDEEIYTVTNTGVKSQGGITLDLTQGYSNYWLPDNIGITAFVANTTSGIRQDYTLFFAGGNVWNLPKNLYLENNSNGISYGGFIKGLNILHIWSDNAGTTFNGIFLDRGFGQSSPFNHYDLGSCCFNGSCNDYWTEQYCLTTKGAGAAFKSLLTCASRISAGQINCGTILYGTTGACCCGVTGCVDSSNSSGTVIDQAFCNTINGKFYSGATCGAKDKYPEYGSRSSNTLTEYNICTTCGDPVACCRQIAGVWTCSQETDYYCKKIGGTSWPGYRCTDPGFDCAVFAAGGNCLQNKICNRVAQSACTCGTWFGTSPCSANMGLTGFLNIQTLNPQINIVHNLTNTNSAIKYTTNPLETNTLRIIPVAPTGYYQKYKLDGEIEILDNSTTYSIWDTSKCITVTPTDNFGTPLSATDILDDALPTTINLSVDPTKSPCVTDQNFKAKLKLRLISCPDGLLSNTEKSVDIYYTNSPCTCLGYQNNDIVNKAPIVIPFTALRYCNHCTVPQITLDGKNTHIPYPLKQQTGLLTFCPPTGISGTSCGIVSSFCVSYNEIQELSGCTYSSKFDGNGDWYVGAGVQNSSPNSVRGDSVIEGNTLPAGCYHAEYNVSGSTYFHGKEPQEAFYPDEILYLKDWFSACDRYGTDWDSACGEYHPDFPGKPEAGNPGITYISRTYLGSGINPPPKAVHQVRNYYIPYDFATLGKPTDRYALITPASRKCRRFLFINDSTDCDNNVPFDPGACEPDPANSRSSGMIDTNPGQGGNWISALSAGGAGRYLESPYFNTIKFDDDALKYISQQYNVNPNFLQYKLFREINKYGKLFDPAWNNNAVTNLQINYGITSDPGYPTPQLQQLLTDPLNDIGGSSIDVDDKARAGCTGCKDFFNKDTKIQVQSVATNDISTGQAQYYVYGLVLSKTKDCTKDYITNITQTQTICTERCGGFNPDGSPKNYSTDCTNCISQVYGICGKEKQRTEQIKYYTVIIRKPTSGSPCVLVYDLAEQQIVYKGDLRRNGGGIFCRGGDIICPTDCNIPTKIKELVWLGDLTTNSISTAVCSDTVKLRYTLNDISKIFTGYDEYQYTSITDSSFFSIDNLSKPTGVEANRLSDFASVTSNIFCKTASTDYLNIKCAVCANDDCYADVIPKLMEFIGPGCSVDGFICDTVPSATARGLTFINGTKDRAKSFVQITGNPVYWLIESKYYSGSGLTIPAPTTSTSITGVGATFMDNCGTVGYDVLDNRVFKTHNISYLYTAKVNGIDQIRLSKNLETAGATYAVLQTLKRPDGVGWFDTTKVGHTGGIIYLNNLTDTSCTGYKIQLPKINVNGYRPTISIENLGITQAASGSGSLTVRFKPTGSFFRTDKVLLDLIDNQDLNIKIIKLNGTAVNDVTATYMGSNFIDSNYTDVEIGADGNETGYVVFTIPNNISTFKTENTSGLLYFLFNVNNYIITSDGINWSNNTRESLYQSKYFTYRHPNDINNDTTGYSSNWKQLWDNSWTSTYDPWSRSILGDFDLKQVPPIVVGGLLGDTPPIPTNKKINGVCINIDCTQIGQLCDNLEGC